MATIDQWMHILRERERDVCSVDQYLCRETVFVHF